MKKLYIKTFGCQMNVYDSSRMRDALRAMGYHETDSPADADIILLNTCHIREKAAEKMYSEIGRMNELKKSRKARGLDTALIVAGCVVQAGGAELMRRAHAVDIAVGPQNYHRLPELIARRGSDRLIVADFPTDSKFDFLPQAQAGGAVAYVAVQEGCDHFCSYCVVPYTRGCEYSRPAKDILDEVKSLVRTGAKEIMLLGQNVNGWHGEGKRMDLGDLIRRVAEINGVERIRYTTSYPSETTCNLIAAHADTPKLMPYIHLPIQSGSDKILKAMNRAYTAAEYERVVAAFRAARPDIAVSSDFIVGFPDETEEDFEQTMELVRRVKYAGSFSFKFSARPGTPASLMKNQVPEAVKTERLKRLQELLLQQQKAFNQSCVGREMDVLLTEAGKKAGQLVGYSPYMQGTVVAAPRTALNTIVRVKITKASATALTGELISTTQPKKEK